ncbi:MAG: CoA-binding protein [Desulfuromonas sp.]|nr:MAG: CoA-binding protein [Desulfuromonas sp.]
MSITEKINDFLAADAFGVVGASSNRDKYGNKVLRCYLQNDRVAIPVNPRASSIEGIEAAASVADLPDGVDSISVITPPAITVQVVEEAIEKGIRHIWMQPGAESTEAIKLGEENGLNVIADGSCILVVLGYKEH